jgi:multimeric flavodoxin WrbA
LRRAEVGTPYEIKIGVFTMKVLLLNGSPRTNGCTYTALYEVAKTLKECGVDAEIMNIGTRAVHGCTGCGKCAETHRCVFDDDCVNQVIDALDGCDGFIVGSPVYYASPNGAVLAVLDRVFYAGGRYLAYKPGASVCSARRAGTTATLDALNKYFTINNMPLVSSQYWNMVHGQSPADVAQDLEGLQVMRNLARNMAWLLKSIDAGKAAGIEMPKSEPRARTNFIR